MLMQPFVVARKELVDHARDVRSVALSALYALMGPAMMLLAFFQRGPVDASSPLTKVLPIMAAVFALMAAFTGSMAAAMDTVAGERERRSLVPLLVTACYRLHVIIGKWIALTALSTGSLVLSVLGFALVFGPPATPRAWLSWFLAAPALLSLGMVAAALEILISTLCRSMKEANTYVSILVFGIAGVAMWMAFTPQTSLGWFSVVPMLGQQRLLASGFAGGADSLIQAGILGVQSSLLAGATALAAAVALAATVKLFERDEAVYGG